MTFHIHVFGLNICFSVLRIQSYANIVGKLTLCESTIALLPLFVATYSNCLISILIALGVGCSSDDVMTLEADITDHSKHEDLLEQVKKRFGKVRNVMKTTAQSKIIFKNSSFKKIQFLSSCKFNSIQIILNKIDINQSFEG